MPYRGIDPSTPMIVGAGQAIQRPADRTAALPAGMIAELRAFGSAAAAYALFEDSLRLARGETVDAARARPAALWERFSAVAAANPFAWDRTPHSESAIATETADNR